MGPEKIRLRFWDFLGCQVQNDLKLLGNRFLGSDRDLKRNTSGASGGGTHPPPPTTKLIASELYSLGEVRMIVCIYIYVCTYILFEYSYNGPPW